MASTMRDPRPVRLAGPNYAAMQTLNNHAWLPAPWHRPLGRWWEGDLPVLPPPVEERWPTFMPGERPVAPRRPSAASNARPAPPSPEEIARLHAESRARAAARFKDIGEEA